MLGQLDHAVFAEQQVLQNDQTRSITESVEQACSGSKRGLGSTGLNRL
jgi:hypothetical protein